MTNTQYVLSLIADECQRVQTEEGFTAEHDKQHIDGELAKAAAYYALPEPKRLSVDWGLNTMNSTLWPFEPQSFKPRPDYRMGELIKAGQFIVAEMVRLYEMRHNHLANEGKDSGMTFEEWKAEYIAAGVADGIAYEDMSKHTDWDDLRESYEYGFGAVDAYKEGNYE